MVPQADLSCRKPQDPKFICKNVIYTLNVQPTLPFKISAVNIFDHVGQAARSHFNVFGF